MSRLPYQLNCLLTAHKVAITYITDTLTLVDIIGEYMLLAVGDEFKNESAEAMQTFLLRMQGGLSITNYLGQKITAAY